MNFFLFILYFQISTFISVLLGILIYKLFIRKNCNIAENIAIKTIDDYFKAYDHNIDDDLISLNDSDLPQFNNESSDSPQNLDLPNF